MHRKILNRFIHYVSAYPDPELLLLGYDSQFHDLDRFCASPVNFSILSIDPTLNLGSGEASALCLVMKYCASAGAARRMLFRGVGGNSPPANFEI